MSLRARRLRARERPGSPRDARQAPPRTRAPRIRRARRRARAAVSGTPPGTTSDVAAAARPAPISPATRPSARLSSTASVASSTARGTARPQEHQVAAVAFGRPERGEVREPERHERAWNGEHDVERLRVERVARGRCQAVRQVVDEAHPAEQRPLDPVPEPGCASSAAAGDPPSALGAELRLHLPLDAVESTGDSRGSHRGGGQGPERGRVGAREGPERQDRDLRGRLGRRRPGSRVERLEEHVGRGDERHAAHGVAPRCCVGCRCQRDRRLRPGRCNVAASCWSSTTAPARRLPCRSRNVCRCVA